MDLDSKGVPGNAALSRRLIENMMSTIDVAYAEEWKFDHGIMVPLHFLDPDNRYRIIPANINCQGPPLTPLARVFVSLVSASHLATGPWRNGSASGSYPAC